MNYRQPICKALTTDILMGGGARSPVILNGTLLVVSVFALGNFYLIPVFVCIHGLIIRASKRDSKFFDCFKYYIKYKEYYHS